MFEDATFDARGAVRNFAPRWMMVTAAANAAVVAGLIVAPMLITRSLGFSNPMLRAPVYTPQPETPRPVKVPEQRMRQSPVRTVLMAPMNHAASRIDSRPMDAGPAPISDSWLPICCAEMAVSGSRISDGVSVFHENQVRVKQGTAAMTQVSSGVVEGLLLPHATPAYPTIARSAGISGDVMLAAVISTEGRVERLHVVSGNPLLRDAAISAVKDWRYKPYLLDGRAVEVETTITIRFSLHGR